MADGTTYPYKTLKTAKENKEEKNVSRKDKPLTWGRVETLDYNDCSPETRKLTNGMIAKCCKWLAYSQTLILDMRVHYGILILHPDATDRFVNWTFNYDIEGNLKDTPHVTQDELAKQKEAVLHKVQIEQRESMEPLRKKARLEFWAMKQDFNVYEPEEKKAICDALVHKQATKEHCIWVIDRRARLAAEQLVQDLQGHKVKRDQELQEYKEKLDQELQEHKKQASDEKKEIEKKLVEMTTKRDAALEKQRDLQVRLDSQNNRFNELQKDIERASDEKKKMEKKLSVMAKERDAANEAQNKLQDRLKTEKEHVKELQEQLKMLAK